jgi:hypothetical protein
MCEAEPKYVNSAETKRNKFVVEGTFKVHHRRLWR